MPSELPEPLTVSQLTRQVKHLIEDQLPSVLVQGEVSNLVRASSGHLYLTLKDEAAQLRAVMWRGNASRLRFSLEDGLQVLAVGAVEVYMARGTYQLVITELSPIGVGPLELAFRQLHDRLNAQGLFEIARKRSLPVFPRRIALITSPTGAAVRDILQVLRRRWPACDVVIVPVPVQGDGAAPKIADALRSVHEIPGVDVVIAGRGGGSLEDLWAFNEEEVAYAIFNCRVPVVSAVGHEIDLTIADLVADRRALTPSEAAEIVTPNVEEVRLGLDQQANRLRRSLQQRAARFRVRLEGLAVRPWYSRPFSKILERQRQLDQVDGDLRRSMSRLVDTSRSQIGAVATKLDALNPLGVLARGYSITFRETDTQPLTSCETISRGDLLRTRLSSGQVISVVQAVEPSKPFSEES